MRTPYLAPILSGPVLAASVHYFRLEPAHWRAALASVRALGFRFVDTYVPWSLHEQSDGRFDFGKLRPELDVALFLRIAGEEGLAAVVRPGPHVNAELTGFGIPDRVIWDEACQARGPSGAPVVLPVLPRMFPVPSYASAAFLEEVEAWFAALGPVLAPLCASDDNPDGIIKMVQVDNEAALYFRDGAYDQDYHPDAEASYRRYVEERYGDVEAMRRAYPDVSGSDGADLDFDTLTPPRKPADSGDNLPHHLDWAAFQEHMIARALSRMSEALKKAGFDSVPTSHNFPIGHEAGPLNAPLVESAVDVVGLDYYNRARPGDRVAIARRTSELSLRSEARGVPALACEMGCGSPAYFPPLSEADSAFTLLTALAYGLRGYNLYMAVERDRWVGAPLDRRGRPRASADFYRRVNTTLERVAWHTLRRRVPVRVVVPRSERRLARTRHAFGPMSAALMGAFGLGAREGCIEDEAGSGPVELDTMLRAFEQSLEARGVPFAVVGGEGAESTLAGASWVILLSSMTDHAVDPGLAEAVLQASRAGARITAGPALPEMNHEAEHIGQSDPRSVDAVVATNLEHLDLALYACDPDGVHATVHEDAAGQAQVVFVLHIGDDDVMARVTLGVDARWQDPLIANDSAAAGETFSSEGGTLEIRLGARSVRMLVRVDDA